MAWSIDNFGVRKNGFLGIGNKWWDVGIYVDEVGNVSIREVPGKNYPLPYPCLNQYDRNNRSYSAGQLITEFCNLDTFTNYRIYAQDCEPFAYTETDLNAAKCGYVVPLPTPFVPPTPWGQASYGFYAYLNFCDVNSQAIDVRIYKRNYVGASIKINNGGASPAILSYKNDDNKFATVRALELQLTLVSDGNFNLEQLYTQDEREFKIQVTVNGVVKFLGFGTAAETSEEFRATPYDVTYRATDGLGALKKIDYPLPIGATTDIKQTFLEVICFCLALTNLNLDLNTICNVYELKMSTGINDDPLAQASINPLRFVKKGTLLNCYDVLVSMCQLFGAFIVQDNGAWYFVRQTELSNSVLRKRVYKYTGFFLRGEQFYNSRIATCKGTDISMLDDNPTLRIGNGYKRAEAVVEFGDIPFLLYNGGFEIYNGSNFAGWTKYGGIKVSQIEKQIITTSGSVGSGNFALQFDELANNSKYFEASKIQVVKLDKITLSLNVGKTSLNNSVIANTPSPQVPTPGGGVRPDRDNPVVPASANSVMSVNFKMRVKLGNYYLTNPADDGNYQWVTQLATCTIPVNNPTDVIDAYSISLEMPAAPDNGNLVIQLFGFTRATPGTYYPVYIDNITLDKSTEVKTNGRILYATQQDAFYTDKPDQIKLLFGDVMGFDGTSVNARPVRQTYLQVKSDQYAIITKDGTYSTGWFEYGGSTKPVPLGLILTRSIMKAYQNPFRFLQSSFFGNNISYLDIFNVFLSNNPDFSKRVFSLLSGDFDLKSGELRNANYAEIFSRPGKTIDIIVPGNEGDPSPPIAQNPNPTPEPTERIFTQEFKQEFK